MNDCNIDFDYWNKTVTFCDTPPHVAPLRPPQFELPIHGRIRLLVAHEHIEPAALNSEPEPQAPTIQEIPFDVPL